MTPEQEALRDAFLAECWAPVREYHQTDGERAASWMRQQGVNGAGEKARKGLENGTLTCDNGQSKTAPGPVVGATGRIRGLTPERDSEAPMNHALSSPCRQQVSP